MRYTFKVRSRAGLRQHGGAIGGQVTETPDTVQLGLQVTGESDPAFGLGFAGLKHMRQHGEDLGRLWRTSGRGRESDSGGGFCYRRGGLVSFLFPLIFPFGLRLCKGLFERGRFVGSTEVLSSGVAAGGGLFLSLQQSIGDGCGGGAVGVLFHKGLPTLGSS